MNAHIRSRIPVWGIALLSTTLWSAVLAASTSVQTPANRIGPVEVSDRTTVDLGGLFAPNPVVVFSTTLGYIPIELLATDAPVSVANFLRYLEAGDYDGTIFHRSFPPLRIVQGGGYRILTADAATQVNYDHIRHIPTHAPIRLEYGLPNTYGTLAMARTNELDSATSEWFFNVQDNTNTLGPANNGGYAVFGRVIDPDGLAVMAALESIDNYNGADVYGAAFANLPLRSFDVSAGLPNRTHFLVLEQAYRLPEYSNPAAGVWSGAVTLALENPQPSLLHARIEGSQLVLESAAGVNEVIKLEVAAQHRSSATASATVMVVLGQPSAQKRYFPESYLLDNGWTWIPWMTFIYADFFPWIFTNEAGWLYGAGEGMEDSYWFWKPEQGWLWTNPAFYPYHYALHPHGGGSWESF